MTEDHQTDPAAPQDETERLPWQTPVLVTLAAGDAENGAGSMADDQINFS